MENMHKGLTVRTQINQPKISQMPPKFICPNCLPNPKSLRFRWKKALSGVRSPWTCPTEYMGIVGIYFPTVPIYFWAYTFIFPSLGRLRPIFCPNLILRNPQNLKQSFTWFDVCLVNVKSTGRLFQIFVAFWKCSNFKHVPPGWFKGGLNSNLKNWWFVPVYFLQVS